MGESTLKNLSSRSNFTGKAKALYAELGIRLD
jgi:hypothetical protein